MTPLRPLLVPSLLSTCGERPSYVLYSLVNSVYHGRLFHGTGKLDPVVIYRGTIGFDPRCTREGNFYGRGVYFAEKASYVEGRFVYEENGTSQLFLANVLCGNVMDFGSEKAEYLTRPPKMPGDTDQLYDSVQVRDACCNSHRCQAVHVGGFDRVPLSRMCTGWSPQGLVSSWRQGYDYAHCLLERAGVSVVCYHVHQHEHRNVVWLARVNRATVQ